MRLVSAICSKKNEEKCLKQVYLKQFQMTICPHYGPRESTWQWRQPHHQRSGEVPLGLSCLDSWKQPPGEGGGMSEDDQKQCVLCSSSTCSLAWPAFPICGSWYYVVCGFLAFFATHHPPLRGSVTTKVGPIREKLEGFPDGRGNRRDAGWEEWNRVAMVPRSEKKTSQTNQEPNTTTALLMLFWLHFVYAQNENNIEWVGIAASFCKFLCNVSNTFSKMSEEFCLANFRGKPKNQNLILINVFHDWIKMAGRMTSATYLRRRIFI